MWGQPVTAESRLAQMAGKGAVVKAVLQGCNCLLKKKSQEFLHYFLSVSTSFGYGLLSCLVWDQNTSEWGEEWRGPHRKESPPALVVVPRTG